MNLEIRFTVMKNLKKKNHYRIIPGDEVARNLSGPSRPAIYKRRPSSPNPNAPVVRANDATQRAAINEDLSAIRGKLNPVKELQMLARQNSNNDEVNDSSNIHLWPICSSFPQFLSKPSDDVPPFNFQGMLRKTQHQRASMKRNKSENSASPTNGNVIYHNNNSAKVNFDFDENENFPSPPPPVAPRIKSQAPVPSERTLSFGENIIHESGSSDDLDESIVQEEIQPGVVLTYNVLEQQEAEVIL